MIREELLNEEGKFSLEWEELDSEDRKIKNTKHFSSEEARKQFSDGIEKKDNFAGFTNWSNPDGDSDKTGE
jgi:hypothetical protein